MPQTKFQDFVFTIIMATLMVYGMICYNVIINMGGFTPEVFTMALHELPIMAAIAFILEFFVVGKIAPMLAFKFLVTPKSEPKKITMAISFFICMIMCPLMSGFATVLFSGSPSLLMFAILYARNLPVATVYSLFICGPFVRLVFRTIFKKQLAQGNSKNAVAA